jgi:predicted nucleotidyltransferase
MSKTEEVVMSKIIALVRKNEPSIEAYLFGSRARGDARDDSDWDILVLSEDDDFLKVEDKLRDELYQIELDSGQIISLFTYSRKYWHEKLSVTPLYKNVVNEGVRL